MQCEFMWLCIQFLPLQMTIYSSFFPFYRLQLPPFMETLQMKWNETKPNEIQWNRLIHLYWYQVANVWTEKVFSYMNRNETLKMWWKDKVWVRTIFFAAATTLLVDRFFIFRIMPYYSSEQLNIKIRASTKRISLRWALKHHLS